MRQRTLQYGFVLAAACALVAAGCNREAPIPLDERATVQQDDDESIATYVRARYQTDSAIRANDIHVSADDGVVTLRGTVPDDKVKQHAVQVAQQMDGVRSVTDLLEVETAQTADVRTPTPGTDDVAATQARRTAEDRSPGWITTKIQAQYFVNREVAPWNIDVTTSHDGVVTLRGEVEDTGDRDEAVRIARDTEGVTRVENQLRVGRDADRTDARTDTAEADRTARDTEPDVEQPDAWVTAKVQAKYFMDSDVKSRSIDVDTRDGAVTLRGEVESEGERRQALALARNTEGVRSVIDQLQVRTADADRAANDAATNRTATGADSRVAVDDVWITTKVQSKFFLDDDVKGRDINVDSSNGVVVLKGVVESEAEKEAAETLARDTDGVTRVENLLEVDATPRR